MSLRSSVSALASRFHPAAWWGLAIVFVAVFQLTQRWLDSLYTLSRFPVPYYIGQTTFDAARVKSYYAVLIEQGTLDRYVWVQIADYGYMATVFAAFVTLMIAVYRSLPSNHWLKAIAFSMIFIAPMAPVFDALENLVSFVMLSNPTGFSDWLVHPYSALACAKFAVYIVTYLWTAFAVIVAVLSALIRAVRSSALKV